MSSAQSSYNYVLLNETNIAIFLKNTSKFVVGVYHL